MTAEANIDELSQLYGIWGDYVMSKSSSLIGGLELSGIDPQSLSKSDLKRYSVMMRYITLALNENMVVSQYYVHYEGFKTSTKERTNVRSNTLSKRRNAYLNEKGLSGSNLYTFLDIAPSIDQNSLLNMNFFSHLANSFFSAASRQYVSRRLSMKNAILFARDEAINQSSILEESLASISDKLDLFAPNNKKLSVVDQWDFNRFMHSLNPSCLQEFVDPDKNIKSERWDYHLGLEKIEAICLGGKPTLKFGESDPVYARVASVISYGSDYTDYGLWANGLKSPVLRPGNYIISHRFKPLSAWERFRLFFEKENELERQNLNVMDLLKGTEQKSLEEKELMKSEQQKKLIKELQEAQAIDERYGLMSSQIIVFDKDPEKLTKAVVDMNSSLSQAGLGVVWEGANQMAAYQSSLPGFNHKHERDVISTCSQYSATSLLYKSHTGQKVWGDHSEEPLYIFESDDGTPFHYSPYVNDRCLVIGIGPIRTGKSFTKNTLASHFMKFGGYLYGLDIDAGMEPIADFFGEDGGVFKIEEDSIQGLNPFSVAQGPEDHAFIAHMSKQVIGMIACNDNKEMKTLTSIEQVELDKAIIKTLNLPKNMQSLNTLARHCSQTLQNKLSRFLREGRYGHLFDCESDGIGKLDKKVAAFNLSGIKDDAVALPLVMNELFYRVVRLFESPKYRHLPKYLDCDEVHNLLKIPGATDFIVSRVRTWGKHYGGMGLWTQSPKELINVPDWSALRSAATTFFFMADSQMDKALYKEAFLLTDGELEAISQLTPKGQALIIQRDLGVSKVINLRVEDEQYVVNTSRPSESAIRRRNMEKHANDIDKAIEQTIIDLGLREAS